MKNTNAITELTKWKAEHKATDEQRQAQKFAEAMNNMKPRKSDTNTTADNSPNHAQARPQQAKDKKRVFSHITAYSLQMPQFNRQFALANTATAHCKLNFAECFHHKHQLAKECNQLRADLKGGKHLLIELIDQYAPQLNAEQRQTLKAFKGAIGYLNQQLKNTAQYVELVDGTSPEDLPELVQKWQKSADEANNEK